MEASSSAINAPHPDDADDFFGTEGETPPADPVAPDPVDGREPDPVDGGEEDVPFELSAEKQAAEAAEYREQHGMTGDDPNTQDAETTARLAKAAAEGKAHEEQQAKLRAIAEREAEQAVAESEAPEPELAADAPEPEPDPTPAASDGETGSTTEPEPDPTPASSQPQPQGDGAGGSGSVEREYIVFQRVKLTTATLKALIEQVESGDIPQPHIAFLELHRTITRNDRQAVAAAYSSHKTRLPHPAKLAVVSSRSFKERTVQEKPVEETALTIS